MIAARQHLLLTPSSRYSRGLFAAIARRGDAASLVVYGDDDADGDPISRIEDASGLERHLSTMGGRGSLVFDPEAWHADRELLRAARSLARAHDIPCVLVSRGFDTEEPGVKDFIDDADLLLLDHPRDRDDLRQTDAAQIDDVVRAPELVLESRTSARNRLGILDDRPIICVLDDGTFGAELLPGLIEQLDAWRDLQYGILAIRSTSDAFRTLPDQRLHPSLTNLRLRVPADSPLASVHRYLSAASLCVAGYGPRGVMRHAIEQALLCGVPVLSWSPALTRTFGEAVHVVRDRAGVVAKLSQLLLSPEARSAGAPAATRWRFERVKQGAYIPQLPERADQRSRRTLAGHRPVRLLMVPRENAKTLKGGDLVVMEELARELPALDVEVHVDRDGTARLEDYDVIHLFNFALKDDLERNARRCIEAGKRYVVSTFYEDWPKFFSKMSATYFAIKAYIDNQQNPALWPQLEKIIREIPASERWDNTFSAVNAAALLATGEEEARVLRRDYPGVKRVAIVPVGCENVGAGDGGDLFRRETGLDRIVLCVGRFEARKNQLMTLKALEESDLPLVFVGGGCTVQPEYRDLCRRFKRRGRTLFLERVPQELLASAYGATSVHVLPSWYELPGIVSLEAALLGCNVVVSDYGTTREYFGEDAFYCDPADPASIRSAIEGAHAATVRPGLAPRAAARTWRRAAEAFRDVLDDVA